VHPSGRSPDTKKAKVASCPGTRQKPSLDVRFELFWAPKAPGVLFDQIQAQILRSLGRNAWDFLPVNQNALGLRHLEVRGTKKSGTVRHELSW